MIKKLLRQIRACLQAFGRGLARIPYRQLFLGIAKFIGDVLHRALFTVLLPKRYRKLTKQEIFSIIFKSDTPAGKKFDIWLLIMIAANILVIILESLDGPARWFSLTMRGLGWVFTLMFTFEYYLRIYCLKKPTRYLFSFYGIIDFLSIAPAYLSLFFPALSSLSVLRLMRMLRIFRIFKMQRFLDEGHFLLEALRRSLVKIAIFMMFVFLAAVVLGSVMYGIEGDKNPAMNSIPKGIYWAVVTITTVGYGDIAPVTPLGQWVSMLVMLLGYSIIAVPTGIVAGETINEHKRQRTKRHRRRRMTELIGEEPDMGEDDPGARADEEDLM
ncbi:MAG: ion transporter [Bacteroidales bacterium]|nr:ion transporter [Bacteroidales bacterium]